MFAHADGRSCLLCHVVSWQVLVGLVGLAASQAPAQENTLVIPAALQADGGKDSASIRGVPAGEYPSGLTTVAGRESTGKFRTI